VTHSFRSKTQQAGLKNLPWLTDFFGATPQSIIKGLRIILCLGFITIVVLGSFFLLPANLHYHVTERFIFTGADEDAWVYFGLILPKSGPYQSVENVEIFWNGIQQKEDYGFVDTIKFAGEKSGQEDLVVVIKYDVKLPQGYISWTAPVESFQRLPQTGIESDSPPLQEQASLLVNGITDKDVYKIYSFTADHLSYAEEDEDCGCANESALRAYETRSCVCTGFARLMTALCRASSIPSQMMIGIVFPPPKYETSLTHNPGEGHAWVEYYAEGNWKMADPTWGSEYSKILQFNRNDGRHISYGELEQLSSVIKILNTWALDHADQVLTSSKCFRCYATSKSDQISLIPVTAIQTYWDGRWANTLVIWAFTTWLLRKYRDKIIGPPHRKTEYISNT